MQTIRTKYLGATNMRPSRYKVTSTSGISITGSVGASDSSCEAAEKRLIIKLVKQLGWVRPGRGVTLIEGALSQDENVFVLLEEAAIIIEPDGAARWRGRYSDWHWHNVEGEG